MIAEITAAVSSCSYLFQPCLHAYSLVILSSGYREKHRPDPVANATAEPVSSDRKYRILFSLAILILCRFKTITHLPPIWHFDWLGIYGL